MDKKEYISRLANFLIENGTTMAASELAHHLNRNNFKTSYNTEYKGGRGTYALIRTTYKWLAGNEKHGDADNVADAFTKYDGNYAYS